MLEIKDSGWKIQISSENSDLRGRKMMIGPQTAIQSFISFIFA